MHILRYTTKLREEATEIPPHERIRAGALGRSRINLKFDISILIFDIVWRSGFSVWRLGFVVALLSMTMLLN